METKIKSLFSCLFIFLFFEAAAVGFAPVRNFPRQSYGGGSQNWSVTQDAQGRMYFANRDGLLKYDGIRWSMSPLPNYTTVRAVLADSVGSRVFAGGSGEFGFFHTNPVGRRWEYVSLVPTIKGGDRNFTEIWHIHDLGNGIYAFQGDYKLFVFNGSTTSAISCKDKITASGVVEGRLYLGTSEGKLLVFNGDKLVQAASTPAQARIVGLLPYAGKVMVVTASHGLYMMGEDGVISELPSDISAFLKENQAFSATFHRGVYAFGTVNFGAVVKYGMEGETIFVNKTTGLQDNTVLGLGFDFSSNLWLCLDNGISYAMVDSPVFNLLGGVSDAGAGYSSLFYGNTLYLATNRGLFTTPYPFDQKMTPPQLNRLHSGQVWELDTIGKDLFVSADDGLYLLPGGNSGMIRRFPEIAGGSWSVEPLKSHPGKALVLTYNGFFLLSRENGAWMIQGKVEGFNDAGGRFVEDDDGNIWVAHWMKGVYRLRLDPGLKKFSSVKLFTSADGLPSERDNSVALHDGKLIISTASGEFYQPDGSGRLVRNDRLSQLIPLKAPAHILEVAKGTAFAMSPNFVWEVSQDKSGNTRIDTVTFNGVAGSLIPGFEHIGVLDAQNILISHQDGFYNLNPRHRRRENWKNGVFVETVTSGDSILLEGGRHDESELLKIPYALNSLTFHFSAPEYRMENGTLFSCRLDNYDDEWSAYSEQASKEYTHLHEGDYVLKIRALNRITGEVAESEFRFVIEAPWYRTVAAKIIYAVCLLLLIYVVYKLLAYLSERRARKVKEQKENEMNLMKKEAEREAIKKDFEIASLKSEQLELDIKHKSSELSNTTMNVIRKNEILLDISSMLNRLLDKNENEGNPDAELKKDIEKIQTLIGENISHDDDWKKFHQNFDIVYADFTRHLSELHPTLTVAEKRLCCYLKMGLSSKEIAPIFSISPKSVEMNRYRLRQKLGLQRSDNLVEYLQGI